MAMQRGYPTARALHERGPRRGNVADAHVQNRQKKRGHAPKRLDHMTCSSDALFGAYLLRHVFVQSRYVAVAGARCVRSRPRLSRRLRLPPHPVLTLSHR
ncbi:hypothetical protein PUNSTDRAFT_123168 [Punctularia strigosozonata HHB-11173 SS5]|uniref:Uncharacterized protein n=1 Tax=Punctularia strigosozonata (strain HHB-11173) TaxID=741275 RepID=R7S057_PUNST|nr:uncharacterized protein PUNSTDRAFT_123168 [Punctularia strigosozonata HHB-11173 SS5]EIN03730.1 hypothetical protein PUNSTDRAFT_123168 [Punctularia strigosozonata HHB-11173 SS5]